MSDTASDTPVAYRQVARSVIEVAGPDAVSFLQGQLSQDVAGIAVGGSAWSLLLNPKGRIDAWMRVTRTSPESVLIDTDESVADGVVTRLNRFKLRTDCTIEAVERRVFEVRGAQAETAVKAVRAGLGPDDVLVAVDWPGVAGFDVLSASGDAPAGLPTADDVWFETLRVAAAMPKMGAEISTEAIPAEFGDDFVQRSASFTKGCYVGQELVARMASRGANAPKTMTLARGEGPAPEVGADAGTLTVADGSAKGEVTSAVPNPDGGWSGLAMVHRSVEVPGSVQLGSQSGSAEAQTVQLLAVAAEPDS